MGAAHNIIFFPPFRLDPLNAQLWRGAQKLDLRPKTFDVLTYLVSHAGRLVTKAELLDAIWPDVSVSDSMPAVSIGELRKALGEQAKTPLFIETIHGRGYCFIAKVTTAAPTGAVSGLPSVPRSSKAIVVGREDGMARLRGWYAQALEGERRVVFVTGEVGIGKTALVDAFLETTAGEDGALIARGQCIEQHWAGEPYMSVLEALTRLARESSGKWVIDLLERLAPTWLSQMPALLTAEQSVRLHGHNQGVTQQRMLREMVLALEALTAEAPLVLVLEDLHWSGFSTLELVAAVARRSEPARLLVVGTHRPVVMLSHDHPLRAMKQELELHHYCEELRLKLLSEQDVASYLERRFPNLGALTFEGLAPIIYERTDGNPLFMVNVVDHLIDAGLLKNCHEPRAAGSAEIVLTEVIEVPRGIRNMIEHNFERLKPEEQATLGAASVAGTEFSAAAVAAALERPLAEIEACCADLARRELFVAEKGPAKWPDGTITVGFLFRHALYQEVLYSLLPLEHRARIHRLIAMREEAGHGEAAGEVATELAHHYSRANDRGKAIHYFRLAAERAVARGATVEAEVHYRRALELLATLPQSAERDHREFALQMALGNILWSSKSWSHSDVDRAFKRAEELAETFEDTSQTVAVLQGIAGSANGRGEFKLALALKERMVGAAMHNGDRAALCGAHTRLGETLVWRAQYVHAQTHLMLGSGYYDEGERSEMGIIGVDALALAAIPTLLLGFPDRARQLLVDGLRRAERLDAPFWLGIVRLWGAMLHSLLRDGNGCLEHAHTLRRLAAQLPVFEGLADANTGRALMLQGQWEEGFAYVQKGIAFHGENRLFAQLMWAKLDEIEYFVTRRQVQKGLAVVHGAMADSEELAQIRSPVLRLRANLLALTGTDAPDIDAAYCAAIDCARSQGAKYYELQAAISFARWLKSQGRAVEARTILGEIYNCFTEGFDTADLKDAKALLEELSR